MTRCPDANPAYIRGKQAENDVADWLVRNGYTVIGRNVRVGHLELDIVAKKDGVIAIVEVRFRGPTAWQSPLESICIEKQNRLRKAAEALWQDTFARDPNIQRVRIDVAAVQITNSGMNIELIENAIDAAY